MPTRFMASRSAVMPSRVILPLSQNQYTHGRADSGGEANPFSNSDTPPAAWHRQDRPSSRAATEQMRISVRLVMGRPPFPYDHACGGESSFALTVQDFGALE